MKLFTKLKQIFCIHELLMLPGYNTHLNSSDEYENNLSRKYILECTKCGCRIAMIKRWTTIEDDIEDIEWRDKRFKNNVTDINNEQKTDQSVTNVSSTNEINKKANLYSIAYGVDIEKLKYKFAIADDDEFKLVTLREYLSGERYNLDEDNIRTEEDEKKYKFEIGYNMAIDKAIKMIDEMSNSKFIDSINKNEW